MALYVVRWLILVGLASMTILIQIATCPTHINLTSIMINRIHNSTYTAAACLDTNIDVAMWAEYRTCHLELVATLGAWWLAFDASTIELVISALICTWVSIFAGMDGLGQFGEPHIDYVSKHPSQCIGVSIFSPAMLESPSMDVSLLPHFGLHFPGLWAFDFVQCVCRFYGHSVWESMHQSAGAFISITTTLYFYWYIERLQGRS